MNWGVKLIIAMALFMGFVITLAVKMINSEKDDLVEKNYYDKGINYDVDYNRKANVQKDNAVPQLEVDGNTLTINFVRPAVGVVHFRHSKDKAMDRDVDFNSAEKQNVKLPLNDIKKGFWNIAVEWKSDNKDYLYQKELNIK